MSSSRRRCKPIYDTCVTFDLTAFVSEEEEEEEVVILVDDEFLVMALVTLFAIRYH
jgi:hypothetical protein